MTALFGNRNRRRQVNPKKICDATDYDNFAPQRPCLASQAGYHSGDMMKSKICFQNSPRGWTGRDSSLEILRDTSTLLREVGGAFDASVASRRVIPNDGLGSLALAVGRFPPIGIVPVLVVISRSPISNPDGVFPRAVGAAGSTVRRRGV